MEVRRMLYKKLWFKSGIFINLLDKTNKSGGKHWHDGFIIDVLILLMLSPKRGKVIVISIRLNY